MAKRAKKLREQQGQPIQQQQQVEDVAQRKKGKEYRPRMQRKSSASNEPEENNAEENNKGPNLAPQSTNSNYGSTIDQQVSFKHYK
jgi:hypothetical protein